MGRSKDICNAPRPQAPEEWGKKVLARAISLSHELRMPELKAFASSVAVVVSSCDAFFDAWRPFVFFFRKYWPDCPFPVFLIVNELRIRSAFVQPISVGPDREWASNMIAALAALPQPYILYFQEDYFVSGPVNNERLAQDFAYAFDNHAASFCLHARGQLEANFQPLNDRFGIVPPDSDGRTRLQVTLWDKSVLLSTLRPGETAWNMEARASERTRDLLALSYSQRRDRPIPYLMSAIVRGLWTREAMEMCREAAIEIQPRFRSVHSDVAWRRRFRRGWDRLKLAFAVAKQRRQILNLDTLPE
ncbi:MAG TPA: hypothetical protein VH188_11420 [Chthoniobacterales bacterium]|nr:hypothetical protein [Chthoniobacterales bacterium]